LRTEFLLYIDGTGYRWAAPAVYHPSVPLYSESHTPRCRCNDATVGAYQKRWFEPAGRAKEGIRRAIRWTTILDWIDSS